MMATISLTPRGAVGGGFACALLLVAAGPAEAQETGAEAAPPQEAPAEEAQALPGVDGPARVDLGTIAEFQVPDGFHFFDAEDAQRFLEAGGNPSSKRELGLAIRADGNWFVVFEYSDSGHVKDDDADDLDADALLASLREGNDNANEERKRRGWGTLELLGWAQPPHYDPATRNLEWATRGKSEENLSINHNTRVLGRTGVMEVTLVCDAADFEAVLPDYKQFLAGFDYKSGQRYSEYVAGDKLATYGLTALVAGGAGVLAAKSGLFSKLWKVLVVAAIAVAGFFKKLFGRKADKSVEA